MVHVIPADALDTVGRVVECLESGGVVVLPTDTVYGVAALPGHPGAIDRIFEVKQRPAGMHLAVLVAGADQVSQVSTDDRPEVALLATALWPGALTLVLGGATPEADALGNGDGTIGVRCPDHELVRAIARRVGPIAATSANRHGHPTPTTAPEVAAELPGVDLVVDGGECPGGVASTVVSVVGDRPTMLREGPIGIAEIDEIWPPPGRGPDDASGP